MTTYIHSLGLSSLCAVAMPILAGSRGRCSKVRRQQRKRDFLYSTYLVSELHKSVKKYFRLYCSVPDPSHFHTDPDPLIRTFDQRIRMRIRLRIRLFSSMNFKMPKKKFSKFFYVYCFLMLEGSGSGPRTNGSGSNNTGDRYLKGQCPN